MDIEYKGANCVVIATKKGTIVIDPKLSLVGLKDYAGKMNVQLATQESFIVPKEDAVVFSGPGEYEVEEASIHGIAAQRNVDTPDQGLHSTMYRVYSSEIAVAVIGHVLSPLTEAQLESLGVVDVLIVPVGGNGYTLDAHAAVQVVRQIEPKIVIPTHYADQALQYEVPQTDIDLFIKEIGVTPVVSPKLKLKSGSLPESLTIHELTRTS